MPRIAIEFRQKFHKPVVIDMFCYRRFRPQRRRRAAFTQPVMYKAIRSHKTTLKSTPEARCRGGLTDGEVAKLRANWRHHLETSFEASQSLNPARPIGSMAAGWAEARADRGGTIAAAAHRRRPRGSPKSVSHHFGSRRVQRPPHHPAPPRQSAQDGRDQRASTGQWAEALAFATLVDEAIRCVFPARTPSAALFATCRVDRPGDGSTLHPVEQYPRRAGAFRSH
jgi:2-oxoglutarate dehydrogenase E1 component